MKPSTKNIICEINSYISKKSNLSDFEIKGINLIESSINLLNLISENYDEETAKELTNRFINSIKNKDSSKFQRKIREKDGGQ